MSDEYFDVLIEAQIVTKFMIIRSAKQVHLLRDASLVTLKAGIELCRASLCPRTRLVELMSGPHQNRKT